MNGFHPAVRSSNAPRRRRGSLRLICPVLVLIAALSSETEAQVQCLVGEQKRPTRCEKPNRSGREIVAVYVGGDKPGSVAFAASSGQIAASAAPDARGVAQAVWTGDNGNGAVTIYASAYSGTALIVDTIVLGKKLTLDHTVYREPAAERKPWPARVDWYQNRQLGEKPLVRITEERSDTGRACSGVGVLFKAYADGAAWVDTVWAAARGNDRACYAAVNWKLGTGPSIQVLRASLLNDPTQATEFRARSRSLPWAGLGLAYMPRVTSYDAKTRTPTGIRVSRKTVGASGDTIVLEYDSVSAGPQRTKATASFVPVLSVNFPLLLSVDRLRFVGAVDLSNASRNFLFGASLLQALHGFRHEDVGFDIHAVAMVSRRDVLDDIEACRASAANCGTHTDTQFGGVGLLFAINAGSVFDKLTTALLGK